MPARVTDPDDPFRVSVVVPTRNRKKHLLRLLTLLGSQTQMPAEIIIEDASTDPITPGEIPDILPPGIVKILLSEPHVCRQRNAAIRYASSPYIFLCDDDLEPPPGYVAALLRVLKDHPETGAVTGLVVEPGAQGGLDTGFHPVSPLGLLWSFVFQQGVWTDMRKSQGGQPGKVIWSLLGMYYRRLGNRLSLAGWPVITQVGGPMFRTAIYGLGGAVVRREWLLDSPYDERLDPFGIGDNYGVALGFPGSCPIAVIPDLHIIHHKSPESRLHPGETYLRRVYALHYFLTINARFTRLNRIALVWSLIGHLLASLAGRRPELRSQITRAILTVVTGKNPYLLSRT